MLLALAQDASQKGWWEEYADSLPEDYQQFIGLEHEATAVAIWHVDVVAGLLQTEGYARHIIDSYDRVEPIAPSQVTRLVRVRMRRQQVLDRLGLRITVVLDESVLLRRIGSDLMMYEQLQRLAKECERPNLTLQILPLDGQHTVIGESFVLFGFEADGDAVLQDVVSTEQMRSGFILEGERETHLHRVAFRTLTEAALSPADSRKLIRNLRSLLGRHPARRGLVTPPNLPRPNLPALASVSHHAPRDRATPPVITRASQPGLATRRGNPTVSPTCQPRLATPPGTPPSLAARCRNWHPVTRDP